jgi:hypothetical protein
VLVLDDTDTDLARTKFAAYFTHEDKPTLLHRAVTELSATLQLLLRLLHGAVAVDLLARPDRLALAADRATDAAAAAHCWRCG